MVVEAVDITVIGGFVGGIVSKLIYDEISRRRQSAVENKQAKIGWYSDLIELSKEMKFQLPLYRQNIEYFDQVDVVEGPESLFTDEDIEMLEEIVEDVDNMEQHIDATAERVKMLHQREQQSELKNDVRLYEARMRRLLSQYPEDVDEELLETAALLWRKINAVGMIGALPEKTEDEIETIANNLIDQCNRAILELE